MKNKNLRKKIFFKEKVKKQQIDLLEDNEKELARKNISNLKVIRLLTEKCRQQESLIADMEDKLNENREILSSNESTIVELEEKLYESPIKIFLNISFFS